MSDKGLVQSLLDEITNETSDLPVEQRVKIAAALQKLSACVKPPLISDEVANTPQLTIAKELLAASEAKYRELAESITDPFVTYDANLCLTYRNKAAAEVTHIPTEQIIGKPFSEIFPNLVGSEMHQLYLRVLETHQPESLQNHWVRPSDGADLYFDLAVYPTSDGLVILSKDVTGRVRAEAAQRETHEQAVWMSRLPDENPNPLARVSLDGKILYCNRASAMRSGWGFKIGEQIASPFLSLLEEARMQGKQVERDVQVGKTIFAVVLMPFPNDQYANLYGMEITGRKRAEGVLEKAYNDLMNERNRLLAVMEALPIGIAILDRKGGVIQYNQGYEALWGSPPPPASSVDDYEAYQAWWVETGQRLKPEDWAGAQAIQKGEIVTGQYLQIQRFDGTPAFILNSGAPIRDVNGEITGSAVAEMDITHRVETENALRESQNRFRVALASVPLMVYTCDTELRYTWIYHPMRGFRAEDVLGKRDDEILPAKAAAELTAVKQLALDSGQGGMHEVKLQLQDENTYYILTTEPVRDRQGHITGLTCSSIDITDQKRLETERQEQAIQIEVQRQLMDQRERDRSAIARDLHDGPIQTLSSIIFHLHTVKEIFPDIALQIELNQASRDIRNTIHELREVLNELRPPALLQFGFSKVIQLFTVDICERYPRIEIELDVMDDGKLLPDQARLALFRIYQAGLNNIVRHSGASKAWVKYKIDQDAFFFELRDNGVGFELIQDFYNLTRDGHFGLVGMKERAEAIGGEFSVSSTPGKGTTIVVKGPLIRTYSL